MPNKTLTSRSSFSGFALEEEEIEELTKTPTSPNSPDKNQTPNSSSNNSSKLFSSSSSKLNKLVHHPSFFKKFLPPSHKKNNNQQTEEREIESSLETVTDIDDNFNLNKLSPRRLKINVTNGSYSENSLTEKEIVELKNVSRFMKSVRKRKTTLYKSTTLSDDDVCFNVVKRIPEQ
ncbi:hypothetical protein ABK040_014383 [Willaertia magna]